MNTLLANPWALWLLPAVSALTTLAVLAGYRRKRALAVVGGVLAMYRLTRVSRWPRLLRGGLLGLGLTVLAVGIAGPQWGQEQTEITAGRDVVVVLDLSRSMLAEQPSRLERAKRALFDLCDAVERRGGHRLALVVFAGRARVACPPTRDYDHFRDALAQQDAALPHPEVRPVEGARSGTRIGEALRLALEQEDPRYSDATDIVLLSDGDDPARDAEWTEGANEAKRLKVPVHVVGVGNPDDPQRVPEAAGWLRHGEAEVKTRLDEGPLADIARRTGGVYIGARTRDVALGQWFREVIEPLPRPDAEGDDALPVYRQQYLWFYAAALVLMVLALMVGDLRAAAAGGCTMPRTRTESRKPEAENRIAPAPAARAASVMLALLAVVLVSAAPPAEAEEMVRRGNEAFSAEEYDSALELYGRAEAVATDPGLVAFNKGAALFRLGRHREAELHFRRALEGAEDARKARALYDLGNCLLQQAGDRDARMLEQAVRCFRGCARAEEADATLKADAAHNQELARLLWHKAKARGGNDTHEPKNNPNDPKDGKKQGKDDPGGTTNDQGGPHAKDGVEGKNGKEVKKGVGQEQKAVAGPGNIMNLPDSDQLMPLPPEDAVAHLERAAERILRERREHWRSSAPALRGVKDW